MAALDPVLAEAELARFVEIDLDSPLRGADRVVQAWLRSEVARLPRTIDRAAQEA